MNFLTEDQRNAILKTMSKEQVVVLFDHKKRDIQSMFLNEIFSKDDEWEFVDYNESSFYQNKNIPKSDRLYCACGKEVKYQYILKSKHTGEQIGLSLQHFSEHTNIPINIAKNVKEGLQEIDRHLDGILVEVYKEHGFQSDISIFLIDYSLELLELSNRLKETVSAFSGVNLPLGWNDYWNIKTAIDDFKKQLIIKEQKRVTQERKARELSRKRPMSLQNKQLIDDVIIIIDQYYVTEGSVIDIRDIVRLLVADLNYKDVRLIGYVGPTMEIIANEICPDRLVRDSFYLYRKLTPEKIS
ncbi:hypothetical protein [Enterococcus wangshanyuanii]|uniref:Uncharacterized protein n=1 Tax=Enterococcus wangshanyuanii TaxID=2005703 RepID=A0ABQ1PSR4_9ENTE|nr:hypothetical protein [Enterococcus wangshanyuanii]GGD03085.1 hypothetical protein GCM10011573_35720 [Enterococcus wangshanyuanii]